MKTKNKRQIIVALAVLSLMELTSSGTAFAQSSSGSRGDGFSLVSQFSSAGAPIKIPEFTDDKIRAQLQDLKNAKPNITGLKYQDLFRPEDQKAFNELQAQISIRVYNSSKDLSKVKKLFVEGSVVYDHFLKDADARSKEGKRDLGNVAATYSSVMLEAYNDLLRQFSPLERIGEVYNPADPVNDVCKMVSHYSYGGGEETSCEKQSLPVNPYIYQIDTNGKLSALARITDEANPKVVEAIFGTVDLTGCQPPQGNLQSCGWLVTKGSLADVAQACSTGVCVGEVEQVAQEMLASSLSLNEKVKFQESQANKISLFFDPQNSTMRWALSNYIDRVTENTESSAPLNAILGLTNLAFIPTLSLIDSIVDIREIKTSFNFHPTYWSDRRGKRTKAVTETLTATGVSKLL